MFPELKLFVYNSADLKEIKIKILILSGIRYKTKNYTSSVKDLLIHKIMLCLYWLLTI